MKRTYLKFAAKSGGHLPRITSRRLHIGTGRHNIAYRSDAPDEDEDELLDKKLGAVKSALEKHLTRKQREDLEKLEETIEEKLAKRLEKKSATFQESLDTANKAVTEMKAANEVSQKSVTESATKIVELEKTIAEQKERADKNQGVIDAFVVNKDKEHKEQKPKSLEDFIKETVLENTDAITKFARKETKSLILDLKIVGDMGVANVTGSRWGQIFAPAIVQGPYRKTHIRDLLPTDTAGPGTTFIHMREATTGEGDVAPTAETSTKPQLDLDLVESSVNFEVIAGWLRVTRKAMNNIPGFIAWLQRRLPEKLMRVEDAQLLYGNGATPNLKGISHADNHVAETSTATVLAEKIIDAISQLEDEQERYATGVVLRPKEYYNFFKNKAGGSGEYDLPRNFTFVNGILYVSGVPVVPTTAVEDGDFFVGDWQDGAQLLIQEGMRLEFFEQDGTNVRENKITVRIEETVAFPVYGESYFIMGEVPSES